MMDDTEKFEHDPWLGYEVDNEDKKPLKRREHRQKRQKDKEKTIRRKKERQRKYSSD